MSAHDSIAESEPERPEGAARGLLAPAAASPVSMPARVLALQRTAGNRAVGRALGRPRTQRAPVQVIQRRRLPQPASLVEILSDQPSGGGARVAAPDAAAHQKGLDRLWARIASTFTAAEQAEFVAQGYTGLTSAQMLALPLADQVAKVAQGTAQMQAMKPWELQERWAKSLEKTRPAATLGDPLLIDTGARPGTSDAANITTLVDNANKVFDEVAAGTRDQDVKDVFGPANLATAKLKIKNARKRMNELNAANKIVTDRSGYSGEAGLGGLSNSAQIAVAPGVIDSPNEKESIVILFHESMHAGNGDVKDKGYVGSSSFTALPTATKLTNSAHFEVIARRSVGTANFQFTGVVFTPAGSGGTAPLTPRAQAVNGASEMFRQAWTVALNLHKLYVRLVRTPADWSTVDIAAEFGVPGSPLHFSDCLPFWSKVEAMTIHERGSINSASSDPSVQPVTLIDIALSEGTVRRLGRGKNQMKLTEAEALAFETANATPAEVAAATTVEKERDLLILLALRSSPAEAISDDIKRDVKSVLKLGSTPTTTFAEILKQRSPSTFP